MTSPARKMSLEEVLDQFFFSADKPTSAMVLRACEAHPEYRDDIVDFASLWSSYEALPEPDERDVTDEATDESVSRLQSFVLNRIHELDRQPVTKPDVEAVQTSIEALGGAKLRRAAAAAGLGDSKDSALLLLKILTKRIPDVPHNVLAGLAHHLGVLGRALEQSLGFHLVGARSFKASSTPNEPEQESWESAVRSLPTIDDTERKRLLDLQDRGHPP